MKYFKLFRMLIDNLKHLCYIWFMEKKIIFYLVLLQKKIQKINKYIKLITNLYILKLFNFYIEDLK